MNIQGMEAKSIKNPSESQFLPNSVSGRTPLTDDPLAERKQENFRAKSGS